MNGLKLLEEAEELAAAIFSNWESVSYINSGCIQ